MTIAPDEPVTDPDDIPEVPEPDVAPATTTPLEPDIPGQNEPETKPDGPGAP